MSVTLGIRKNAIWPCKTVSRFIHSFTQQIFIKLLQVPGVMTDAGDTAVKKVDKVPTLKIF